MNPALYVAPVRTPATPVNVAAAYRLALIELTGLVPHPRAVAILHAHGALETGHFEACWNGNAGNIKAGDKWDGLFTCLPALNEKLFRGGKRVSVWFTPEGELTDSPVRGGVVTGTRFYVPPGHPETRMRAYESLAKGIRGKIEFLLQPYWRGALDLALALDPHGYCEALRDRGYFTADLGPYARGVSLLWQKFIPVALGLQEHPRGLTTDQEQDAEQCIETCHRGDPRWIYTPQPDPNWAAVEADKARDAREANS